MIRRRDEMNGEKLSILFSELSKTTRPDSDHRMRDCKVKTTKSAPLFLAKFFGLLEFF